MYVTSRHSCEQQEHAASRSSPVELWIIMHEWFYICSVRHDFYSFYSSPSTSASVCGFTRLMTFILSSSQHSTLITHGDGAMDDQEGECHRVHCRHCAFRGQPRRRLLI